MSGIENEAALAVKEIFSSLSNSEQEEKVLFEELGRRITLLETKPNLAGQLHMPIEPGLEGVGDFLVDLGKRLFHRIHRELYEIACGSSSSYARDREKLRKAFGLEEDILISALVGIMISALGVAPVLATVIAALLVKRFLKPAYEETCAVWRDYLNTSV